MTSDIHPVWGVYDLYRTARLNVKYYSAKLNEAETNVFWMDLVLMVTAPGSSVAALWFWANPYGEFAWRFLGAIAVFVAIIKPLLGLVSKIKAYGELMSGYRALDHDLYRITEMISHQRKYDETIQSEFHKAVERKGILVSKDPDNKEDKKLKKRCQDEVLRELPPESFYIPEE